MIIFQQVKNRNEEAGVLNNLGLAYRKLSQYDKAIAVYQQSVKVYESIRADLRSLSKDSQIAYANEIASTYRALAEILNQQGAEGRSPAGFGFTKRALNLSAFYVGHL